MDGQKKVALTFAFYEGDQLVRRETVTQDIVKVGKDPKSHLRVDDEAASRMHAVIEVQDDITLIDLGNETGTTVNGARVNKCKLHPGDQIQIGGTLIVFEKMEDAVAAPAVPAGGDVPAPLAAAAVAPAGAGSLGAGNIPAPPGLNNPFGSGAGGDAANPFAVASPFGGGNPFGGGATAAGAVPADAPEGTYEYQLMKSGPDVPAEEVEGAATAIEVRILWDRNVLHVDHLSPPRSFYVGEVAEGTKGVAVDYHVPQDKLGASRAPIVVSDGNTASAILLPGATGTIEIQGQPKMTIQEAIAQQMVQASSEVSGGYQVPLANGTQVVMAVNDLTFEVQAVAQGKKLASAFTLAALVGGASLYCLGSFVLHTGMLAAMAMIMPDMGATGDDSLTDDQRYLIQQYLDAAAEKELEEKETEEITDAEADNKEGGTGTRAKGEEGSMGNPNTKATGNRYGVKGPQDNPDPHVARRAALRDAAEFGMVGLLNSGAGGDPDAPTAPWGQDDSLGSDPLSARGNMWGDSIGDSFGAGGLGLSGIGEGGGGRGEGIGLGNIGTIGHGAGTGTGQGFGSGHGRLGRSHRARPPRVRMGATNVSGRLPPEVIQRIVRQNFGRFRLCYESALKNNPNLQGRVVVSFVIGRDGTVSSVGGGGDIPDAGVISCVAGQFRGLTFPQPEGGIVTVSYPIVFTPGG